MNKLWATYTADPQDQNPLVLYHAKGCHDGFAAALCAWMFFHGRGQYVAMGRGDKAPDPAGRAVYILDCALSEIDIREIEYRAKAVVVLEHRHQSLLEIGDVKLKSGFIRLDGSKSVAHLAWEYFHPEAPMPALIRYVEDRHLARFRYSETLGFNTHLDTEPMEFKRWAEIMSLHGRDSHDYVTRGEAMQDKLSHLAKIFADGAKPVLLGNRAGLMVNAPVIFHQTIGTILADQCGTYGLIWAMKGERVKVSLISRPGYDTLPLAQAFEGRGKECASLFRITISRLPELLSGKLELPKPGEIMLPASSEVSESSAFGKSIFHGLWSAAAFSKNYDKASWKSVHRQLLNANLI